MPIPEQANSMFQGTLEAPSLPSVHIHSPVHTTPTEQQAPPLSPARVFLQSVSGHTEAMQKEFPPSPQPFRRTASKQRLTEIRKQLKKSRSFNRKVF